MDNTTSMTTDMITNISNIFSSDIMSTISSISSDIPSTFSSISLFTSNVVGNSVSLTNATQVASSAMPSTQSPSDSIPTLSDVMTTMASSNSNVSAAIIARNLSIVAHLWLIFSPIFLVFGLLGNILIVLIIMRLKFKENPTMMLLFILAFTDMTVLIVGLTRYFSIHAADVDPRKVSDFSCSFSLFLIYFSMQLSSWLLVHVTIIRYIKTVHPLSSNAMGGGSVTMRSTLFAFFLICLVLVGINSHFFLTNGLQKDGSCGSLTKSFRFFDEYVVVYVDLMILSVIPAILMFILNGLIIISVNKLRNSPVRRGSVTSRKQTSEPVSKVTTMLVVTSMYFAIASIPICVYFVVDSYMRPSADDVTKSQLDVAWTVLYLLQYSHFASNFYFYSATNERFRRVLQKMVRKTKQKVMNKLQPNASLYDVTSTTDRMRKPSRSVTLSNS